MPKTFPFEINLVSIEEPHNDESIKEGTNKLVLAHFLLVYVIGFRHRRNMHEHGNLPGSAEQLQTLRQKDGRTIINKAKFISTNTPSGTGRHAGLDLRGNQ